MSTLRETRTVLEICPSSNLLTGALADEDELEETVRTFADRGVAFTIATDGPEMMQTHLRDELALLLRIGALGQDEVTAVNERGHSASFVRPKG
jgi:adenosine deaminase